MLWKCCTQYANKTGKLSSGHRTRKGQFSFQSQKKARPRSTQTTTQLHSSHTLAKQCSKFSKPGFNSMWTVNFQISKLDLEKEQKLLVPLILRGTRDQIPNICWIIKKEREFQEKKKKNLLLIFWLHQSLCLWGSQQTVENSERDGNTRPPDLPPEKCVCRSKS